MRNIYLRLIPTMVFVLIPALAAGPRPNADADLSASFDQLRTGSADAARAAEGDIMLTFESQEYKLCSVVERYLDSKTHADEEEGRFRALLFVLSRIGHQRTINLMASHLTFQDAMAKRAGANREEPDWHAYPCVEALVWMDGRALSSLANVISQSDDPKTRHAALLGVIAAGYTLNMTASLPQGDKTRGERFARGYLDMVSQTVTDPVERARLVKARDSIVVPPAPRDH